MQYHKNLCIFANILKSNKNKLMRVICIENSIMIDRYKPDFGSIAAHKGSIYNVVGVIEGEVLREKTGLGYALGPWYEFLELEGHHHHIRFLEIPEDDFETETTNYIKTQNS